MPKKKEETKACECENNEVDVLGIFIEQLDTMNTNLIKISESLAGIKDSLKFIALGDNKNPGCTEKIAMELADIAESLKHLSAE